MQCINCESKFGFPDKLYIYPCRYNYRPDHCMYMSVCKSAESEGVAVLHGSRGSFHAEKQPAFRAIYRAMEEVILLHNCSSVCSKIICFDMGRLHLFLLH